MAKAAQGEMLCRTLDRSVKETIKIDTVYVIPTIFQALLSIFRNGIAFRFRVARTQRALSKLS